MLFLLSPAKTLDTQPPTYTTHTQAQWLEDADALVACLRNYDWPQLAQLMDLSQDLATLNVARYAQYQRPFSLDNAKQAIFAFQGDVYQGLQAADFTAEELNYAQAHLRILSGLYGLLRPLDLMQPYRLEMGTALPTPRGKNLYAYWGDRLAKAIGQEALETDGLIVNLASEEYAKVLPRKAMPQNTRWIDVQFVQRDAKSGQYRTIAIHAKRARGLMARYAVQQRAATIDDLLGFDLEGYRYEASLSKGEDHLCFAKK